MYIHRLINLVLAIIVLALSVSTLLTARKDAKNLNVKLENTIISDMIDKINELFNKSAFTDPEMAKIMRMAKTAKRLESLNKSAQALIAVSAMMIVLVLISMFVNHKFLTAINTLVCLATLVSGMLCIVYGSMIIPMKSGILGIVSGVVVLIVVGSCGVNISKILKK